MWVSTFSLMTSQTLNLLFCFRVYHKINGILSKSVIFFFFFIAGVSEKRGKKKRERERETRRTPESGESYPFWFSTLTRRQKWRVRAT